MFSNICHMTYKNASLWIIGHQYLASKFVLIVIYAKKLCIWFFLVHINITSWIIFVHFKYIALALDLN
jgi:hypothetical protein